MEKMRCPHPECGRRVFDIETRASEKVVLEVKCPHCGRIVRVEWNPEEKKSGLHRRNRQRE